MPLGHEMTSGSQVPPAYSEYRLNIWNGVEKATAHPVGIVFVGVRSAQHVNELQILG